MSKAPNRARAAAVGAVVVVAAVTVAAVVVAAAAAKKSLSLLTAIFMDIFYSSNGLLGEKQNQNQNLFWSIFERFYDQLPEF